MQINVSQLLKSSIGTGRVHVVNTVEEYNGHPVRGMIDLIRTQRGILVQGHLETEATLTCSRCLSTFVCPLAFTISEEYLPVIDIIAGTPLPPPNDPGSFTIDDRHILDLTEAVRQYSVLATPMKPLCHEECAGLCPTCGQNLNDGNCGCPKETVDERWSSLLRLSKE